MTQMTLIGMAAGFPTTWGGLTLAEYMQFMYTYEPEMSVWDAEAAWQGWCNGRGRWG